MSNISVQDAKAFVEPSKLDQYASGLDEELEASVATQVLGRLAQTFDVSSWTTPAATPALIRSIVSMHYVGWYYRRVYAGDNNSVMYSNLLIGRADAIIESLIEGSTTLSEIPIDEQTAGDPVFYPNDLSSAQTEPMNDQDTGWGGPAFTMGTVW